MVFLRVLRFSPTFAERSARYKWNILERAVKPKSKKKKKKALWPVYPGNFCFVTETGVAINEWSSWIFGNLRVTLFSIVLILFILNTYYHLYINNRSFTFYNLIKGIPRSGSDTKRERSMTKPKLAISCLTMITPFECLFHNIRRNSKNKSIHF